MTRTLRSVSALLVAAGLLAGGTLCALAQETTVIVPRKADPNQLVSFSFQQADIDDVLRFIADASGKIVFKDPAVTGTVTIRNQARIPVTQAIQLVRTILSLKGFALQETEDALIVTTTAQARTGADTPISAGKDIAGIPEGRQVITHIFPLENIDAARVAQELAPLFPAGSGIMVANPETNSLLIIDEANKIRRVAQIINVLDRNLTGAIEVEVIRLQFADAVEVARYLGELFRPEPNQAAPQQQGGFPGFPGRPGTPQAQPQQGGLSQLRGRVRFAADERSNSLLVYASPANIQNIKALVAQIDVNLAPRTTYEIVELKYADATAIADQINQLLDPAAQPAGARPGGFFGGFGGFNRGNQDETSLDDVRVVPDVRTNSLIITAPVDGASGVADLIRKLDRPSQVTNVVRTFQLQNAIASEVATTLTNLFQGTAQQGGLGFGLFGGGNRTQIPPNSPLDLLRQVTIVPNDQTNQLLVSGPAQTFPVIESLINGTVDDDGKQLQAGLDRRLPQVFIEVIIADITLDDENKFGIEWNAVAGESVLGTNFGLTDPTSDPTGFRYSILSNNFKATLQALRTSNRLKIISTPHVMVTDNSPALISIGENIPYAGQTTFTQGVAQTSVEFLDVAITLNVTPHISPGNNILMDIDQVVNSLIEFINVAPGQLAPRTTARRAGTTVVVEDDQTVVLGGIISNDESRRVQKVPILGDIPIIGNLFRNTVKSKNRTELVVFITPHIVREPAQADEIRQYERNRLQVDPLKRLDAPLVKPLDLTPADLRRGIRPGEQQPRRP